MTGVGHRPLLAAGLFLVAAAAGADKGMGALLAKDAQTYSPADHSAPQYRLRAGTIFGYFTRDGSGFTVLFSPDNGGGSRKLTWVGLEDIVFFAYECPSRGTNAKSDCVLTGGRTPRWGGRFLEAATTKCEELGIEPFDGSVFVGRTCARPEPGTDLACWDPDDNNVLHYSEVGESDLQLLAVAAGEPALPSTPKWTFGEFDESLYCFHTVEVYAEDILGHYLPATYYQHSIELLVHLVGETHDSWWRLYSRKRAPVVADPGDRGGPALAHVTLAPTAPVQPILDIGITSGSAGNYTGDRHTSRVILDLRFLPPRTLGRLTCGEEDYRGGPCSFHQSPPVESRVRCKWGSTLDGFSCSSCQKLSLSWTTKSRVMSFVMGRQQPLSSGVAAAATPPNLVELLEGCRRGTIVAGSEMQVANFGSLTPILLVPRAGGKPPFLFYSTPTSDALFEPDLTVAWLWQPAAPLTVNLDWDYPAAANEGSPFGEIDETGLGDGAAATQHPYWVVHRQLAYEGPGVRLFRVVIAQGHARGLLLLVVDETDDSPSFGAMLVAVDAVERGHCGDPVRPTRAVALDGPDDKGNFLIDIEPGVKQAGIQGRFRDGCRTTAKLHWDHRYRFVLERVAEDCRDDLPTRLVKINDDGSLGFVKPPAKPQ
jgi:hypothetical protein